VNVYGYVGGNPVGWVDPLGLEPPPYPGIPWGIPLSREDNPFWIITKRNVPVAQDVMNPWTFQDLVKEYGPWDYKNHPFHTDILWQHFGNYHYGVAGAATGLFTLETLLREAGRAQHKRDSAWGCPTGGPPYGDDPTDQYWIREGWRDYWSGMYGKPREPGLYGQTLQYWGGLFSRHR
jgi:hypothetical protein